MDDRLVRAVDALGTVAKAASERAVDAVGTAAKTALLPWGGAEACVDAYEVAIQAATDAQLNIARVIAVEPIRSFAASYAHATRDVGATFLSSVRWILDI
jgi:hypothetical protein